MHAIQFVIDAFDLGELLDLDFRMRTWGLLAIPDIPSLEAALPVALTDLLSDPLVFTNRHGQVIAPPTVALALAKRLCTEVPATVMTAVIADEAEERRESITGRFYGKDYISPETVQKVMREHLEPVWRLVRSWCDVATIARYDEVATLRAEVTRLRQIIMDQVAFLRQDRHPQLANALRSRLNEANLIDE